MQRHFTLGAFLFFCCVLSSQGSEFGAERHRMVNEVVADAAATSAHIVLFQPVM